MLTVSAVSDHYHGPRQMCFSELHWISVNSREWVQVQPPGPQLNVWHISLTPSFRPQLLEEFVISMGPSLHATLRFGLWGV